METGQPPFFSPLTDHFLTSSAGRFNFLRSFFFPTFLFCLQSRCLSRLPSVRRVSSFHLEILEYSSSRAAPVILEFVVSYIVVRATINAKSIQCKFHATMYPWRARFARYSRVISRLAVVGGGSAGNSRGLESRRHTADVVSEAGRGAVNMYIFRCPPAAAPSVGLMIGWSTS